VNYLGLEYARPSRLEVCLEELKTLATEPIHETLLAAYTGDERKESVERKLNRVLIDVLKREDPGHFYTRLWVSQ
jgi:hypothetical protein